MCVGANLIRSLDIGPCRQTSPCSHSARITLIDGRTSPNLPIETLAALVKALAPEKITYAGSAKAGMEAKDHFAIPGCFVNSIDLHLAAIFPGLNPERINSQANQIAFASAIGISAVTMFLSNSVLLSGATTVVSATAIREIALRVLLMRSNTGTEAASLG